MAAALKLIVFAAFLSLVAHAKAQAKYPSFYSAITTMPDSKQFVSIVELSGLKQTLSNPSMKITVFVPPDKAFSALATKLKTTVGAIVRNKALSHQILFYHFAAGPAGLPRRARKPVALADLKPGLILNTMLTSPAAKQPMQLQVAAGAVAPAKVTIKSVGSVANIVRPDIRCGTSGIAHGIDNVLLPATAR